MKKIGIFFLFFLHTVSVNALEVGVAKENTTPSLKRPVWLAGFQPKRAATGVHDSLWARSIVFVEKDEVVAICGVDCIGILHYDLWEVRVKVARFLRISEKSIIISSSHTHSGPDTLGIWGGSFFATGKDPLYMAKIKEAIFQSLVKAYQSRKPVKIRYGEKLVPHVVKDSRAPKIMDPLITAIQAVDFQGKVVGTFLNYAMHPEVLSGRNPLLTSDYVHYLREAVEKKWGGMAIFTPGAIGGMQTPKSRGSTFEESKRIGEELAQGISSSLEKAQLEEITFLKIETARVFLPLANFKFILAAQLGLFDKKIRRQFWEQNYLLPTWEIPADISVIQIGSIQMATLPGELFPELGFEIKDSMKSPRKILIGLANNETGYILAPSAWTPAGYEETMSLGPDTWPLFWEGLQPLVLRANERWKQNGGK